VGCYIWYSEEGTGRGRNLPRPLLAVPNVTAHPSTASVPITVLPYNDPLLCGFNVPIKGLTSGNICVRTEIYLLSNYRSKSYVISNCIKSARDIAFRKVYNTFLNAISLAK